MTGLLCTRDAAAVIRRLVAARGLEPATSGLRLSLQPLTNSLQMDVVAGPEWDDRIVAHHGTRLFLDAYAEHRTAGMVLESPQDMSVDTFVLYRAEEHQRRDDETADRLRRFLRQRRDVQ
ncbi:MAG: hypothetical protein JWO22_795 [Frankiales bacterium]|nr:hypothetical protein [Frankiales bacterium]